MRVQHAYRGARGEGDAEGDRDLRAVLHPVRGGEWDVNRVARSELEGARPALELVAPCEVAVRADEEALEVGLGHDHAVGAGEYAEGLGPATLEREVLFGIHVVGRDGARRRNEEEGVRIAHAGSEPRGDGP